MNWLKKWLSSPTVYVVNNGAEDQTFPSDWKRNLEEETHEYTVASGEGLLDQTKPKDEDSMSGSSIAEDPSEMDPEPYSPASKIESIHLGSTEQFPLIKRGFRNSSNLRSVENLNDDSFGGESSQGYGTLDGRSYSMRDCNRDDMGSQPDWRGMFSSTSSPSVAAQTDDKPTREQSADGRDREDAQPVTAAPTTASAKVMITNVYGSKSSVQINTGDYSHPSKYPHGSQMVTNYGSNRWASIASRAEFEINGFEDENTAVLTGAVKQCIEKLTKEEGDHVAVVVGHDLDGKTWTAKSALAQLSKTKEITKPWKLAFIVNPDEITDIEMNSDIRTCVFKDDFLDKHKCSTLEFEKWQERFGELLGKAKAWRIGVVFVMNKRVYDRYVTEYNTHELFKEENVLDLTDEHKLSVDDKIGILKCHLQCLLKDENVLFTKDKKVDNADAYTGTGALFIWDGYLREIALLPCTYGFPRQAKEYSSSIENVRLRSEFFKRPLKFHCLTVWKIRTSDENDDKKASFVLETLLSFRGKVHIDKLEERFEKIMKYTFSKNKVVQEDAIIKKRLKDLNSAQEAVSMFTKGVDILNHWLIQETDGTVCFASTAIHYATALNLCEDFEANVVKCSPVEFIHTCVRPSENRARGLYISKHLPKSPVKKELYRRLLLDIIKNGNVAGVCGHQFMAWRWFVIPFLEWIEYNKKLTEFVSTADTNTGMTVLFHGMDKQFVDTSKKDPQNLTEELVKRALWSKNCTDEDLKRKQEKRAIYRACEFGLFTTYRHLRKSLDKQCLMLAVESGSVEITEDILRRDRSIEFQMLCDIFSMACRKHCHSNPAVGKRIALLLMKRNCDIDRKDQKNDPMIHDAVKDNDVHLLKLLCELGCSLNIKDRWGNHPLHNCVLYDSVECAEILLGLEANAAQVNDQGLTPLHLSVKDGSIESVRMLSKHKPSLNIGDRNGQTALHLVIQLGRSEDMLESLIVSGADVNKKDNKNHGPLYYAVSMKKVELVKLLVKSGASITETDRTEQTLLQHAFILNRRVAEIMLDCALELRKTDTEIPFVLIDIGDLELFHRMVRLRPNIIYRTSKGDTLLKYAIEKDKPDFVRLLCEIDPSLIEVKSDGVFPLHAAVEYSSLEMCKYLIASGASLTCRTSQGDTLLHVACRSGKIGMVEMILEQRKDFLHETNHKRMTALHIAVEHGHLTVVQILLIMGADPKAQSKHSTSKPLDIALRKRNLLNARDAADIEKVRTYDCILAELRRHMFDRRRSVSTFELCTSQGPPVTNTERRVFDPRQGRYSYGVRKKSDQ